MTSCQGGCYVFTAGADGYAWLGADVCAYLGADVYAGVVEVWVGAIVTAVTRGVTTSLRRLEGLRRGSHYIILRKATRVKEARLAQLLSGN